jgi:hypothetical protein
MQSVAILIAAILTQAAIQAQTIYQPIMTNGTVEALVHNGVSFEKIIQQIRTARDVDFLIDNHEAFLLVRAGASDKISELILQAMQRRLVNGPVSPDSPLPASPAPVPAARGPEAPGGNMKPLVTRSQFSGDTPMLEPPPPPAPAEASPIAKIELGQAVEQVIAALGQPSRIVRLSTREIYFFDNLKITLKNGKVSDVE